MKKFQMFLCCGLFAVGCDGVPEAEEDGMDDSLALGKTDNGGLSEGTPEARGVIRLANEATVPVLKTAKLSARASNNIVGYRAGQDGVAGTADDRVFHSLAEVDAVPYVGPVAFAHLLDYARAHGYITADSSDPFYDLASCRGPIMTFDGARTRFAAGATTADIGSFVMRKRSRTCNPTTGCGPWKAENPFDLVQGGSPAVFKGTAQLALDAGSIVLLLADEGVYEAGQLGARCRFVGQSQVSCDPYNFAYETWPERRSRPVVVGDKEARLHGNLTDSCLFLTDSGARSGIEYQVAVQFCSGTSCALSPPATGCPPCLNGGGHCPGAGCTCYDACQ